ncbi:MAG: mandelate racemase/muconate lactonizing enzyme family protein [Desulfobacterales bacterium]|nr:mandelate racemase/muconate lactonizing enzyme family protein [Desulfobacterales bacterium]
MARSQNAPKGDDLRIVRIELTSLMVPFAEGARDVMEKSDSSLGMSIPSEEPWDGGEFVICRLTTRDGSCGLGEAFVWLPETGVSPAQIVDAVKHALSRYVIGESPFNVEKIRHRMEVNVNRSDVAKGLIDMACYDLMGRITGRPAHDFMGGCCMDEIPLCALIPLVDMETMIMLCRLFHDQGIRTFRLKLGKNIRNDMDIVGRVREELGEDVRLRVDYNQAYNPDEAVRAIRAIEPFGIDFAEQPVAASNYPGMVHVQQHVAIPVMAHEGCFSLQDIVTLVKLGGIHAIGLNGERPGGVTNCLRAVTYAEMEGMGAVLHNQPLGISSAMQIHVAAARYHSLGHDMELFGHLMMSDDLIVDPINYDNGTATVPTGPGWGVELDEAALDTYATGPTVVIE